VIIEEYQSAEIRARLDRLW